MRRMSHDAAQPLAGADRLLQGRLRQNHQEAVTAVVSRHIAAALALADAVGQPAAQLMQLLAIQCLARQRGQLAKHHREGAADSLAALDFFFQPLQHVPLREPAGRPLRPARCLPEHAEQALDVSLFLRHGCAIAAGLLAILAQGVGLIEHRPKQGRTAGNGLGRHPQDTVSQRGHARRSRRTTPPRQGEHKLARPATPTPRSSRCRPGCRERRSHRSSSRRAESERVRNCSRQRRPSRHARPAAQSLALLVSTNHQDATTDAPNSHGPTYLEKIGGAIRCVMLCVSVSRHSPHSRDSRHSLR